MNHEAMSVLPASQGLSDRDNFVHLVAQAAVVQYEDLYPDAGLAVDRLIGTLRRNLDQACHHVGDTISGVRPAATELVRQWWALPALSPGGPLRPVKNPRRGQAPTGLSVCTIDAEGRQLRTRVPSKRVGECMFVHPSLRSAQEVALAGTQPNSWALTHCPTGLLVATVGTERWASFLGKQIAKIAGPSLCSGDPGDVQRLIGGPGSLGTAYLVEMTERSWDPDTALVPFSKWVKGRRALNPQEEEDAKTRAAVAAAIGAFIGGIGGAVVGLVVGASLGALAGALFGGISGAAATGATVGDLFGIPLGYVVGTIWGAVRQTGKAVSGPNRGSAMLGAGVGAVFLGFPGAAVGGYLGA